MRFLLALSVLAAGLRLSFCSSLASMDARMDEARMEEGLLNEYRNAQVGSEQKADAEASSASYRGVKQKPEEGYPNLHAYLTRRPSEEQSAVRGGHSFKSLGSGSLRSGFLDSRYFEIQRIGHAMDLLEKQRLADADARRVLFNRIVVPLVCGGLGLMGLCTYEVAT